MTTYEPGTVAVATVRGVPNVRVFYRATAGEGDWAYSPDRSRGLEYSCDSLALDVVTDVRPLVVLDLDHPEHVAALIRNAATGNTLNDLADQIEAQTQTKPPRIPEPGQWGVVHSSLMRGKEPWVLVRHEEGWVATDGGVHQWHDLIDPTLIREGVES